MMSSARCRSVCQGCWFVLGLLSLLTTASTLRAAEPPPADKSSADAIDYSRDIRPILSDKCFRCHGPDAETRQADLRLDTREGLASKVLASGKPDHSEIITRIFSADDDLRMPPPDSNLSLSADQKELLKRWITEGAPFAEHWSFQPLFSWPSPYQ